MNVKVNFSIKRETKWFCIKRHIGIFVATHPARKLIIFFYLDIFFFVHVLDAVASLVYILFDISGNRNKFVLGTPSFNWQGPDNEIYGQLFFLQVLITKKKSLHYRGSKRLWGSPHQVK